MTISWRFCIVSLIFSSPMTYTVNLPCSVLMCVLISMHIGPWSMWIFLKIRLIDDTLQKTVCKRRHRQMLESFQVHANNTECQSHLRWELWRPCIVAPLQAVFEFPKQKLSDFPFCTWWLWRWPREWEAEVGSLQWSLVPGVQCGGSGSGSCWRTRWTPEIRSVILKVWTYLVMFLLTKQWPDSAYINTALSQLLSPKSPLALKPKCGYLCNFAKKCFAYSKYPGDLAWTDSLRGQFNHFPPLGFWERSAVEKHPS